MKDCQGNDNIMAQQAQHIIHKSGRENVRDMSRPRRQKILDEQKMPADTTFDTGFPDPPPAPGDASRLPKVVTTTTPSGFRHRYSGMHASLART